MLERELFVPGNNEMKVGLILPKLITTTRSKTGITVQVLNCSLYSKTNLSYMEGLVKRFCIKLDTTL
jgi:hypothetical protein